MDDITPIIKKQKKTSTSHHPHPHHHQRAPHKNQESSTPAPLHTTTSALSSHSPHHSNIPLIPLIPLRTSSAPLPHHPSHHRTTAPPRGAASTRLLARASTTRPPPVLQVSDRLARHGAVHLQPLAHHGGRDEPRLDPTTRVTRRGPARKARRWGGCAVGRAEVPEFGILGGGGRWVCILYVHV